MIHESVIIRWLGRQPYAATWQAMQDFTNTRTEQTTDEIWLLEHDPVFTQGQNGKAEHVLNSGNIPVVQTDRGGQVTYHGPGQLMVYTLIDMRRKKMTIRDLVCRLEQSVISLLAAESIVAFAKRDAPGVYVSMPQQAPEPAKKICSIGLRIRRGCSYHGIAFNVSMDLEPFSRINPCGFAQLKMTQLVDLSPVTGCSSEITLETGRKLVNYLLSKLVYNHSLWKA